MIRDLVAAALGLAGGFCLGAVYFAGLSLTVQALPDHRRPALLIAGSYLLRVLLLAGGLVGLATLSALALLAALPGVIAARFVVIHRQISTNPHPCVGVTEVSEARHG